MSHPFWCDRQLEVMVQGPGLDQQVSVPRPFARVGSHPLADVVLPDDAPSKRCVYFHATDTGVFAFGLWHKSSGEECIRQWLAPDQWLSVGKYRIRAVIAGLETNGSTPRNMLDDPAVEGGPYPVLDVAVEGRKIGVIHPRRQLLVVGRRFPAHVLITAPGVSATHCVLYWHDERLWIVDLLSSNGTVKDGVRIQAGFLREGKSIQLESARIQFVGTSPRATEKNASAEAPNVQLAVASGLVSAESTPALAEANPGEGSLALAPSPEHTVLPQTSSDSSLDWMPDIPAAEEPFEAERTGWQTDSAAQQAELTELQAAVAAQQQLVSDREFAVSERETKAAELEQSLAEREQALAERSAALEARAAELRELSDSLARQQADLKRERESCQADVAARQAELEELRAAVTSEQQRVSESAAAVSERESKVAELEQSLADRERVLAERSAELEAREAESREQRESLGDVEQSKHQQTALRVELQSQREELDERKRQLDRIDKEVAERRSEVAAREATLEQRERELGEREAELALEAAAGHELQNRLVAEQRELSKRQSECEAETSALRDELARRRRQLEAAEQSLARQRDELSEQVSMIQQRQASLDEREASLCEKREQWEQARQRQERLLAEQAERLKQDRRVEATRDGDAEPDSTSQPSSQMASDAMSQTTGPEERSTENPDADGSETSSSGPSVNNTRSRQRRSTVGNQGAVNQIDNSEIDEDDEDDDGLLIDPLQDELISRLSVLQKRSRWQSLFFWRDRNRR